ncbi:aminotransferase class I/II-fold pyridoxal phosphate-dependent enzyme [bacterium]|nr:aminotransferase class I/II-fold pyridoxal phosphate-dependent enzyme [bacterium]MBU1636222.1 aminotransferase class I/II-fold pyridoxal phosphate-dependent enzyme [bacterium]
MTSGLIDLRSDTVTQPTDAMRKAMASAKVGDDVFSEDPTVNELQEHVAGLLGKEAALFVPSGTMANQIALAAQTSRGDEILLDEDAHILNYESGAPAMLSGLQLRTLRGENGHLTPKLIHAAARSGGMSHYAPQTLVEIENTHNRSGGTAYTLEESVRICDTAREHNMRIHLDGARLWNAAVYLGASESEIAAYCDSVSVCFSKGLGAPVGSALAGSKDFIECAHRYRKAFGGGMRQAGVIAAGALHAVKHHRARLFEDHENARKLADRLRESKYLKLSDEIQTNIIIVYLVNTCLSAQEAVDLCAKEGVLFFAEGPTRFRLVTHLDFPATAVDRAADVVLKTINR